jgi:hypothetical protein
LRGVLHVRQTVKPDVASRDTGRDTVDLYGREVGSPKKAVYDTVVVRRVFGPAEAALQLRSKG